MNFITIKDLNEIIKQNIYKINGKYDLIVSVPRSGCLPATLISLYLNLPLTDIDSLIDNKIYGLGITKVKSSWIKSIDEARRILIVEDSSFTGSSVEEVKKKIYTYKYRSKCDILSVIVTNESKNFPDLYFDICNPPRMFEWNYIHHKGIIDACFDIDGVLCEEPTEEENDDGIRYVNFIKNATPKFIPTFKIGYIVTSRLEKYRNETEEWLKKNNIKYDNLIMMNVSSKEERQRLNNHGIFKGNHYKKIKTSNIFIESNINQAIEIAKISNKSVFCTDTSEFIKGSNYTNFKQQFKYNTNIKFKKILKKIFGKNYYKLKKIIKGEHK